MTVKTIPSRGVYLLKAEECREDTVILPKLRAGEVQIAPRSTTLCGSDLHYYAHGRNGSITIKEPLCLGHEFAGEVVAVAHDVEDLQPGDKVAVECGIPCSECDLCIEGRYNLCPKLRFRGSGSAFPHFQGSLQERINHPARWTHKLPDSFTYDNGALLEPLAVAVHAVRRSRLGPKDSCLVIGAGAVGLLCAAVARSKGCTRIAICDIDQSRVDFAVQYGFADVGGTVPRKKASCINEELENARELAAALAALQWPYGSGVGQVSVTFECTGVPSCVQTSIYATKSGGRIMLVGMGTPNHTLPLSEASAREVDLMPTWRYADCYGEAIDLMQQAVVGRFSPDIRKLITHHVRGLENVRTAFSLARSPRDAEGEMVIKVVVRT